MRENEAYTAMPGNLLIAIIYFQPLLSLLSLALVILKINIILFVNFEYNKS